MTNEEKSRNLAVKYAAPKNKNREISVYQACNEMAAWKDQQIQEIIDTEIDRANRYHDDNLSLVQRAASVRAVSVLSKYLGKEFPKDRFHFGFVTMD